MSTSESKPALTGAALTRQRITEAEEVRLLDQRLDEELDQSFPASDPLPWHHDIDPAERTTVLSESPEREKSHEPAPKV